MPLLKKLLTASIFVALLGTPTLAQSTPTTVLDLSAMPTIPVWDGAAALTPLAFNDEQKPVTVLLRLPEGTVAKEAHATGDGLIRFATVLSGTMYYADGETVDLTKEVAYPTGSMLLISTGTKHWLSAHDGEVVVLLVAVKPENLTPAVLMQHNK